LEGRDPQAVFSKDGLFDELKKALAERILNAEPDDHLEAEAAEGRIAQGAAIPRRLAKQDNWPFRWSRNLRVEHKHSSR
jgi:transposase-like protein